MVNKYTLGAKKCHGQEKQQLKGVIWEFGQDWHCIWWKGKANQRQYIIKYTYVVD